MTDIARGAFDVKLTLQPSDRQPEDAAPGRMTIVIADGKHSYELEYALDPTT